MSAAISSMAGGRRSAMQWTGTLSGASAAVAAFAASAQLIIPAPPWAAPAAASLCFLLATAALFKARRAGVEHKEIFEKCGELRRQVDLDPLTDLLNRTAFNLALEQVAVARNGQQVIILFFDLDRFKDVNDTLGHRIGDQLLVEVARRAAAVLDDASAFARLGGDEYAAILPWSTTKRPEEYGAAIVEAISQPFAIQGRIVQVAASVGIAIGDAGLDDGHELLRRADLAMYEAKGAPRGAWYVYDDLMDGRQLRQSTIRVALTEAILQGAFEMHFQPIVDARTGRICSAEALLRSRSPALAGVPISSAISIAEESGQIITLTDWTIDAVLAAIRTLGSTPVAVNVSPVYFRQPDFVDRLFDKLLASEVRPELLTVEVTEGVLIADLQAARYTIDRLREIGIRVFLDDFGTGFSSLSYLQHFALDGLKLDKSFLHKIEDKSKATSIIRSIIDVGHSFDMKVVVEGVESDGQARLLQLLGCDLLQGYEIGVPAPLAQLRDALERQRNEQEPGIAQPEPARLTQVISLGGR